MAAPGPLHGKVALVTGGGTGIGRATVLALAGAGADVLVHHASSGDEARAVAAEAQGMGRRADVLRADFRDRAAAARLAEEAEARWGRVDVLVNNAATIEHPVDVVEGGDLAQHLDRWDDVWNVNLRAPYEVTCRLARGMAERGSGCVVNVASVAGMYALTDAPLYSLSKAALLHFTRQAALQYAPRVRVNAVAPGWTETGFGQGHILTPEFQKQVSRHVPLRRVARPEEVADAVLWLVQGASYATGATLVVDGGLVTELR